MQEIKKTSLQAPTKSATSQKDMPLVTMSYGFRIRRWLVSFGLCKVQGVWRLLFFFPNARKQIIPYDLHVLQMTLICKYTSPKTDSVTLELQAYLLRLTAIKNIDLTELVNIKVLQPNQVACKKITTTTILKVPTDTRKNHFCGVTSGKRLPV